MSRQDTVPIKGLRNKLNYDKEFDVVLAFAYSDADAPRNFGLYEKIGEVVETVGKRPFIPHKELNLLVENSYRNHTITNDIVIPTSDLILCYLKELSADTGIMLTSAILNNIPIIYIDERERDIDVLSKIALPISELGYIALRKIIDGMRTISQSRGLEFRFVSIEDTEKSLPKLETAINEFYKSYQNP